MKRSTRDTFYPAQSVIGLDDPICPTCEQPAKRKVYYPRGGADPVIQYLCPVNGDVVGHTTPRLRAERIERERQAGAA